MKLYRYEKPESDYNESREGIVSKKELIGRWFCDNNKDLIGYIFMRKPGGNILEVEVPDVDLDQYDAQLLPETKDMDIEKHNYILPKEIMAYRKFVWLRDEN